jgi:tRNA 2-selenouridine synthase
MPARFQFHAICGPTGSGKSRLLQTLTTQGAQVLDLEKLAAHRGSVLGSLPSVKQPSQKSFESSIWQTLRYFNAERPVFVESESKKIGNLRVPDALMEKMRASPCITLELSRPNRVRLLLQDYAHFVTNPSTLTTKLDCLIPLQGKERIQHWQAMAHSGEMASLFDALLVHHYDPAYSRSIDRNFALIGQAKKILLDDISESTFNTAALQIRSESNI